MKKSPNKGEKFGYLTYIEDAPSKGRNRFFLCKCICGTIRDFKRKSLVAGRTKSCGCKKGEMLKESQSKRRKLIRTNTELSRRDFAVFKQLYKSGIYNEKQLSNLFKINEEQFKKTVDVINGG